MPLVGVLRAMEDAGIKIDTYRMGEITARLADRVEELEASAYDLAGEEFMLGSTQQLARILFEKLELTPGRKGKTGYSTDTKVLRSIRDEHPIVEVIVEWRELTKLLNTYLGPLPALLGDDGRLHTTFNQAVAATGRLSTSNPNLQAIPIRTDLGKEIRSAFVAESGHRLISADYSQIELRILAHVSGEPKLREAFERGEDIHRATAAEVLGVDPAKLTSGERSIAKMINFGIVYGISAYGLSENLEIPREQAQQYIDAYLARFPLVQDFIQRTIEQCERDGYVTSLLGRRRPVPEIRARNRQTRGLGERIAVNFVMQGSNADIIKVAMVAIQRRLRDEGRSARLVLQVHDELLVEAPDAELSAVKELVRSEMCARVSARPAARRRRRRRRHLGRGEELERVGERVRDETESLFQLLDQRLRLVEQRDEIRDLLARHLQRDADRGAGGGGDRDRLLVVAGQRRQVEVLVAAEPRARRELLVGDAEPLREDAGIVPGHVHRRLAARAPDRARPLRVAGLAASRVAARPPPRSRCRRSGSARPRRQGIGGYA